MRPVQIQVKRQDGALVLFQVEAALLGNPQTASDQFEFKLQVVPIRQLHPVLVVVQKQKSAVALRPGVIAQAGHIFGVGHRIRRQGHDHGRQPFAKITQEIIHRLEIIIDDIRLPELAQRPLEIVAQVGKRTRGTVFADKLGSALIHVIAQHIAAPGRHHQGNRFRTFRRNGGAILAVAKKSRPGLDVGHRILGGIIAVLLGLVHIVEQIVRSRFTGSDPGITALPRQKFTGHHGRTPRSADIDRRHQPGRNRQALEHAHVFLPARARKTPGKRRDFKFIFQLHRHDRAAILEHQAVHLPPHLRIPLAHIIKIARVIRAHFHALIMQILWQAAIETFAVAERADPEGHIHPVLRAQLHEVAYVPLAGPGENAFVLLMHAREDIRGNGVQTAGLHLQNFLLPIFTGIPRRMHFARNHDPRFPVALEIFRVAGQPIAGRIRAAPIGFGRQIQGPQLAQVQRIRRWIWSAADAFNFGLRPICVIHAIAIAGIAHPQRQSLDTLEVNAHFLGRCAGAHHAGFPQHLAIAQHLKRHRAGGLGVVIHAHPRAEPPGRAMQVERKFTGGVRAHAMGKMASTHRQRPAANRRVHLWNAPALAHPAQVQLLQPYRPIRRRQRQHGQKM